MRILLPTLTAMCIFFCTVGCNGQKKSVIEKYNATIESVHKQNIVDSTLATGWYYIVEDDNGFGRELDKSDEFYFIDPKPILVKDFIDEVAIYETDYNGQYEDYTGLSIKIEKKYVTFWADATEKSIGKRLGFIIDDKLLITPIVNDRIEGGMTAINRGDYSREELEGFMKLLQ